MLQAAIPAFFLACSWFWCIGGFFPMLLARDFGHIALPFFMIFNIAGATLFGWVWRNHGRESFLARMRGAAETFSVLVAGYHVLFITWISILVGSALPLVAYIGVTLFFLVMCHRLPHLALPVFALTLILFAIVATAPAPEFSPIAHKLPFLHQIMPLALGFLLAPYFDLTFHRAFASTRQPRASFLLGFAILFAVLLAGMVITLPAFAGLLHAPTLTQPAIAAVVILLILQTGFTTAAHMRELAGTKWLGAPAFPLLLTGLIGLGSLHVLVELTFPEWSAASGELMYRGFVFIIGVIFPVILLFGGVNRQAVGVIAFLTPCYTLGFLIGGDYAPFLSVGIAGLMIVYALQHGRRRPGIGGKGA